jgi:ATP-dependent 26S proteasome regulatory subunit
MAGILIEGPPGSGKTALANWIVSEMKGTYKHITLSCADLVHKVSTASSSLLHHQISSPGGCTCDRLLVSQSNE